MAVPTETITLAELETLLSGRIAALGAGQHDHGAEGHRWHEAPLLVEDAPDVGLDHLAYQVEITSSDAVEARAKHSRQAVDTRVDVVYSYQRRPHDDDLDRRRAKDAALDVARCLLRPQDAELLARLQSVRLVRLGPWRHAAGWTIGRLTVQVAHDLTITDPSVGG